MDRLRGLQDIPSAMKYGLASMPGQVRTQYKHEIFNELAQLGKEKIRLNEEKGNWQKRINLINVRLRKIEKREESLQRQMAMKENIALGAQNASRAPTKERREVIIKY